MPAGSRPSRIGDQLRAELSDLITREVHDPGIGFLTITHVKVTPDLQIARVYYTTLGDDKARRESRRALERASPFLRRQLGSRLRLKRVPSLEFFFDESIERGDRIERILHEISAERAEAEREEGRGDTAADESGERHGRDERERRRDVDRSANDERHRDD
jgi:ribosome-binding factor A